jgi:hypothetical protein
MGTKHGIWTVVFEDKMVYKKTGDASVSEPKVVVIDDDAFWNQSKFSNIHAIQFTDDNVDNDQVEYKDGTDHSSYDASVLGNFNEFITRFDTAWLAKIQEDWDSDNEVVEDPAGSETYRPETSDEKISRLGARPTSYTS